MDTAREISYISTDNGTFSILHTRGQHGLLKHLKGQKSKPYTNIILYDTVD